MNNRLILRILFSLIIATTLSFLGCKSNGSISEPIIYGEHYLPRWTSNIQLTYSTVYDFNQDNRIYETEHFLIFSDAADDETKIQFAEMGERAYKELKELFNISEAKNFTINSMNPLTKIQIICNKNDPRSQKSYPYGFMLYTLDSRYCFATEENIFREVKHELTHVFQMYLDGSSRRYLYGWFREGLAEFAADGGFFPQILSLSDFIRAQNLLDGLGIHPLKIPWSDLNVIPSEYHYAIYSMSGLAMRYLLDPKGCGKSITNIKDIFSALKQNTSLPFESAFENNTGISIHQFENDFYDNMMVYLSSN
jgi:hypothetical protein